MRILLFLLLLLLLAVRSDAFDGRLWHISTGNLSVSFIQHSPVGAWPGHPFDDPIPTVEQCRQLKKEGLVGYEDYVGWGAVELEPGKWTWDRHDQVCRQLKDGGLDYVIYPWLQFPPKWLRESGRVTLMRCVEHNQDTWSVSIFDPKTVDCYEAFYREVARHFGDKVDAVYACILGPYGEGNYPIPITDWCAQGHIHNGYWCADRYAIVAFRNAMRTKYRTISELNDAWGTDLSSFAQIHPPKEIAEGKAITPELFSTSQDRRRWLDFYSWYEQALADFSRKSVKAALKYFPREKVRIKPGGTSGGANPLPWATYCPGFAKALKDCGIIMQPADCHGAYFADKWYSTAYRYYGIRFATEPAGGLPRETFINRMFSDASNGASQLFTYEWDAHKADVQKYVHLFNGKPGQTDAAVYYPITLYRLGGSISRTINLAMSMRDIADYDVLDDLTINDGALDRYRVFIVFQSDYMESSIWDAVTRWVKRGGILVYAGARGQGSKVGDQGEIERLICKSEGTDVHSCSQTLGKGFILSCPQSERISDLAPYLRAAIYNPKEIGSRQPGMPEIDSEFDNIWSTLRDHQLLLLNYGNQPVKKSIRWQGRIQSLELPPHEITEIKL